MTDFTNKNILVMGGSRGIGEAIVKRFAKDGGDVTFTYAHSSDRAEQLAAETDSKAMQSDSAERDGVIETVKQLGALDVIVVNAGVLEMGDPLELDPDAIDRMIDINVRAPYHAFVEAGRQMNENGRMIVIGSTNADRMPFPGGAAYALSKSAMKGMVQGLARDFGERSITVNAIQPGPVDTEMNPADGPMKDMMHGFMAIKRHARADEIAGMAAYLAGEEAGIVTGASHTIDGGFGA
ncbi:SDR family oxidoreductase [Parasphingorhabdus litoris]|uniref:SDR family oxidoreductase n=1 Tax=Parasphingorhabdus litoris TaxID=394733 RepID=A0ABN1B3M5_9SPHN|nr:SDR family oxidoreductase [Parasphingorhabdus litoris]